MTRRNPTPGALAAVASLLLLALPVPALADDPSHIVEVDENPGSGVAERLLPADPGPDIEPGFEVLDVDDVVDVSQTGGAGRCCADCWHKAQTGCLVVTEYSCSPNGDSCDCHIEGICSV